MEIAELFEVDDCQAVKLPNSIRFEDSIEVLIKKEGAVVLIFPKDKAREAFMQVQNMGSGTFAEDVFKEWCESV